ncbi:MAG: DUF4128 domain-containing protein [Gammaproteobacteria bacterium]|nr:DUF4128 domain-containing protein [Gammaproteobacteria bacterium]
MGTFQDIRQAIEVRMGANWTTTPIVYENVSYTPTPATPFVRLLIEEVDSKQVCMSTTPCHRITGLIVVMIFVPVNTGTNTIRGYADTIAGIFRNADFSGIKCRSPRIVRVGDIGEWYQVSVFTDFWKDVALANAS